MMDGFSENADIVAMKFRAAGAVSQDTAKTLEEIGIEEKENRVHFAGLAYLLSTHCIKHSKSDKKRLYLDENAYAKPVKSTFNLKIVIVSILITILIFAVLYIFNH